MMLAVAVSGTAAGTSPAQERVTDLLGWVPAQTNLVLFVDAEALGNSAIAKKDKWGTGHDPVSGLDTLPPGVSQLVVASRFSPGSGVNGEVFVARLKKPMTDADLLKCTGGTQDKLAGKNVVLTPNNRYVVNLAPGIAGVYQLADRQDAALWLREATGKPPLNLSPVLAVGGSGVGQGTPVVLVVDTTDMLSPALVKAKLAKSDTFKDQPAKVGPVADLFGQLQYLTLSIRASDTLAAEIKLEFGASAAPLDGFAQPLMLEVLKRLGFHIAEMDQWKTTVQGKTVAFHGSLTKEGANDLLAPLLRPSLGVLDQTGPEVPADQLKLQASRKYFQVVQKKLDEAMKTVDISYDKYVSVYNSAARYIEELPLLNVDEELINWGSAIAAALRTMGIVVRSSHVSVNAVVSTRALATVSTPPASAGGGYPGGYSWNDAVPGGSKGTTAVSNYATTTNIEWVNIKNWPVYREEVWKNIRAATVDLRRKLTKKYNVEF
jgi:hypothetical protein